MKNRRRPLTAGAVLAGATWLLLLPAEAQAFTNPAPINLPGPGVGVPGPTPSPLYPSNIVVSGLTGTVTDVNVTLNGLDCSARGNDYAFPEDVDIMLVGPTGANAVIFSDVGGNNVSVPPLQFGPINITLDDQAASPLPADAQLSAGTYQPFDDDDDLGEQPNTQGVDLFPGAPAPSPNTALSTFNGTAPNGTWSLYVVDDYPGPDNCRIGGGWTLDILTSGAPTTTAGPTTTGAPTTTTTRPTTTTVGGPNLPPVAVNDAYTTRMNTPLTAPAPGVLANDSDPNGDPLTAGMPTQPNSGTLNLNTNGGFTYTPNPFFIGTDTWTYMAHDPFGGMTTATVTITVNTSGARSKVADFDGNGRTDVSVYRPSTGQWGISSPPSATQWGQPGDIPAAGDYNGDGKTETAVFRPSTGAWYIGGTSPMFVLWGQAGDVPVPADYDGNGTTDVAVYRPSNGAWYLRTPTPSYVQWGTTGDIPVPGDYDGNGTSEPAIYRPSAGAWYLRTPTPAFVQWGTTGDIPAPADYDGNRTTDVAVFRPSTGFWYLRTPTPALIQWGQNGDVPVPGDYDGNGTVDVAVFRPGNGAWYLRTTTPAYHQWGINGDAPVPLPAAIHRSFF